MNEWDPDDPFYLMCECGKLKLKSLFANVAEVPDSEEVMYMVMNGCDSRANNRDELCVTPWVASGGVMAGCLRKDKGGASNGLSTKRRRL